MLRRKCKPVNKEKSTASNLMVDGYAATKNRDVVGPLSELLSKAGAIVSSKENKVLIRTVTSYDTPWVHVKLDQGRECHMNLSILFKYFGIIPKQCRQCWKVVVRPRTLVELFKLLELEIELSDKYGYACKCGIETRDYTHGLYGGYFYNLTLEDGKVCYDIVRKAVDEIISPDVKVILKRGCTEIELQFGDSAKWEELDIKNFDEIEDYAQEKVVVKVADADRLPRIVDLHTQRNWVDFAYEHGDQTYKQFTGGKPLYNEATKYHMPFDSITADGSKYVLKKEGKNDKKG